MDPVFSLIDIVLHIDKYLPGIIDTYGIWTYLILFGIIFCETGLVVIPYLPGDSLLFVGGAMAGAGYLNIELLLISLFAAAVIGDTVNYWIGDFLEPKLETIHFINKDHLKKTQDFYIKYGGKTIIIGRFIPIVRTFAPFVAGIGTMNSFQGLKVKEFYGDRFAAFAFEHNFGEVIPGVFRIPNVASFGLEFLIFGNIGYSEFSDNTLFSPIDGETMKQKQTAITKDKFYYEAGIGINQILIFLRFDISARFTQNDAPKFFFTLGGASF